MTTLNPQLNPFCDRGRFGEIGSGDTVNINGIAVEVRSFISQDKYSLFGDSKSRLAQISAVAKAAHQGRSIPIAAELQRFVDQIQPSGMPARPRDSASSAYCPKDEFTRMECEGRAGR